MPVPVLAHRLPRSFECQITAEGLGPPYGRQLGAGLDETTDPSESAEAVEVCPGGVFSEDELQIHLPVLRLPTGIAPVVGHFDSKLPAEGQRGPAVVPVPSAPLDDEPVTVLLKPLDPFDLDLEKLPEGIPRDLDIAYGVGLGSTPLQ
ncbi:hypothetical protein ABZT02_21605 [Streptomyces sp. NPDC005402]|uniref:hypothetical protein n=1 Tax=Streptomyces sp. NPDC005402 TaxID=3155338 RepID=UPI0033B6A157